MKPLAQKGLGAIAAIVVLVLLAMLAAAVVRMAWSGQNSAAQSVLAARATQAARSGIEWGLHKLLKGDWAACSPARSQVLDLRADTGMQVAVSCSMSSYQEGADGDGLPLTVRVYQLEALACNALACPGDATALQYVERLRRVTVSDCITSTGAACP
ncbi:MAG: MSHA biogenesis protein MshP [Burkholderiales bacterium]|uniref:MSHA biogenesis protein MshP n=1 Tax=Inhella sp. TaxID=1921806 RepID=UPI001AC09F9E|nr:MSHA biogenesis protein MshP [Burkholderiales bacterium]